MHSTLLIGLALSVGAPAVKEAPKKEAPSIVGEWIVEKAIAGGVEGPVSDCGFFSVTFTADGMLKIKVGTREKPAAGTYKLDTKKTPFEIDLIAPKGGSKLGIYKIDVDTLTICHSAEKGEERPTKFESPEGSKIILMVHKREKK